MDVALIFSAGLLGLVGAPHCTAMCSAPCAAVTRKCGAGMPRSALAGFMTGRLLGYAIGGAAVATGVLAFSSVGRYAPFLRPVWTVVHVAALTLGLWLLFTGRQPVWWSGAARIPALANARSTGGWRRIGGPARAGAAGAMWLALPCGLLQSALLIAALASSALHGAAVMAAFALTSSLGLGVLPMLWSGGRSGARGSEWAARLAGLALAMGSGWALGHGLWERVADFCLTA